MKEIACGNKLMKILQTILYGFVTFLSGNSFVFYLDNLILSNPANNDVHYLVFYANKKH